MLALIGWLALLIPLGLASIFVFFITVPTWSDAFFSMQWYYKILGVIIWVALVGAWVWWFSMITVTI